MSPAVAVIVTGPAELGGVGNGVAVAVGVAVALAVAVGVGVAVAVAVGVGLGETLGSGVGVGIGLIAARGEFERANAGGPTGATRWRYNIRSHARTYNCQSDRRTSCYSLPSDHWCWFDVRQP